GAVSRVEPIPVAEAAGGLGIAEVAAGGRRPAEVKAPLLAVPDLVARGIHDAQLVARERHTAADEAQLARVRAARAARAIRAGRALPGGSRAGLRGLGRPLLGRH